MKEIKNLIPYYNSLRFPNLIQIENAITEVEENSINYYKNNCDMNLLKEEQEKLKSIMLEQEEKDYFEVCNMECSTGKTHTVINAIPYYLKKALLGQLKREGILIVLRQISECNKYTQELNSLFDVDVAISINSDDYQDRNTEETKKIKQEQLIKVGYFPVVFITHSKYQLLCENEEERKTFTRNRRLLIIDESIDICEIVRLDNKFLDFVINDVLCDIDLKLLQPLLQPLLTEIEKATTERNVIHNFKMDSKYLKILDDFECEEIFNKYSSYLTIIKKLIFLLRCVYSNICLINVTYKKNSKTDNEEKFVEISTTNYKKNMWTLKNNIILDASAKLNMKYELDKKLYHLLDFPPVLDHRNWNLMYVNINSTKTAKGIMTDDIFERADFKIDFLDDLSKKKKWRKQFYKVCSNIIQNLGEKETLAIGTKVEHIIESKRNDTEYKINPFSCKIPVDNIAHYGDITGKREYGDLKNVLIFHTFNYRDTDYILQYLYYANIKNLKDGTTFDTFQSYLLGNIPLFKNQKLQEYKEKTMANHLYQAIKRVNREMVYNTNVVVVSVYLGAILYVRDMLTNCNFAENRKYFFKFNGDDLIPKELSKIENFKLWFYRQTLSENTNMYAIGNEIIKLFTSILENKIPFDLKIAKISEHILALSLKDFREYCYLDTIECSKILKKDTIKDFLNENLIIYNKCKFYFILY